MNRKDFVQLHGALCDSLKEITARKNADYTGAETDNPFYNFETVERLGITSTTTGFLTRMTDKLSRITSLLRTGVQRVVDESIEDTLLDLANYCILMVCYLRSKKAPPALDAPQETGSIEYINEAASVANSRSATGILFGD